MSALVPDFMPDPDYDIDKKTMINTYLYFNSLIEDCKELAPELNTFLSSINNNPSFIYRKNCQRLCIMLIQKILTKKTISDFNKDAVIEIITFLQNYYVRLESLLTIPIDVETLKSNVSFTISFIYYCLNNKKINNDSQDENANKFHEIFTAITGNLATDILKMGVTGEQTGGTKKKNKTTIKKNPIKKDNKKSKEKSKKK